MDGTTDLNTPKRSRSAAVNAIAWVLITLGTLAVIRTGVAAAAAIGTFPLVGFAWVAWPAGLVIASVGLLRRSNWARLALIALLAIGVVMAAAQLGSILSTDRLARMDTGDTDLDARFRGLATALTWAYGLLDLSVIALSIWAIALLRSGAVRTEFLRPNE
jgi:hypothetical protein